MHGHEAVKDQKGLDEINPNLESRCQVPQFKVHLPNRASRKEQRTPCPHPWDGVGYAGLLGLNGPRRDRNRTDLVGLSILWRRRHLAQLGDPDPRPRGVTRRRRPRAHGHPGGGGGSACGLRRRGPRPPGFTDALTVVSTRRGAPLPRPASVSGESHGPRTAEWHK